MPTWSPPQRSSSISCRRSTSSSSSSALAFHWTSYLQLFSTMSQSHQHSWTPSSSQPSSSSSSERYSRSMISLSSLSTTSPRPSPTISLRSPSSLQIRPWVCDGVRTASKQQDRYERSGRSSVHPHSCRLRHSRRRRRHRLDDHWSSRRGSVLRGRVPGPSSCVQPRLTPRFAISSAASRYESAPLECGSYEITVCP